MLFGDEVGTKRRTARLKALPSIPVTGWRAPDTFPNLASARYIAIDTESKDPNLLTDGPGWGRGMSHMVGVSLAAEDHVGNRGKWYFPMRHEVSPEENLNPQNVIAYLKHTLGNPYQYKVGANLLYDIGNLNAEGIGVAGELDDVQFAEAIIDNNAFVGLEHLGKKYLGEGKNDSVAEAWSKTAYGKTGDWRANIYRCPPSLIGPYAEDDADMPLRILPMQGPLLDVEDLWRVYRMECDLIRLLIKMRFNGVHVDVEKAHTIKARLLSETEDLYEQVYRDYGVAIESTDSREIAKLFDAIGVTYPLTKAGNPSFKKEWLEACEHPVADVVNDIREHEKIVGTFLQSYIIDKNVNGIIYPQFHPLRDDEGGTMLGRFSSSHPNLQNIPSRTKLGKEVRACFTPRPGRKKWRKHDYSQIHYRLLAHFAVGPGSDELRQSYIDDPEMDYHMKVYQAVAPRIGWNTDFKYSPEGKIIDAEQNDEIRDKRRPIKNTNFSLLYGVGQKTLARRYLIGMDSTAVDHFFKSYYEGAPYVKPTMEAISHEVEQNGFVTTLAGRRVRFDMWEQRGFNKDKGPPLPYDQAIKHYGTFIQHAFLYRAVNYKFQGSEPDVMKAAMLALDRSGVFDFVGVPVVTVHDELDWEQYDTSSEQEEAFRYVKHVMETTTRLRIPIKVDASVGDDWAKAK